MVSKKIGIEIGLGLLSCSAGINYHLWGEGKRSNYFGLTYNYLGFDRGHKYAFLGSNFNFRSKKGYTASLGLGRILTRGPAYSFASPGLLFFPRSSVFLTVSFGIYF
ncbi:MAG: hypothetical protein ACJAY8_001172 [Sphingobacteriales bacterium]|jgi:hypothetical protein